MVNGPMAINNLGVAVPATPIVLLGPAQLESRGRSAKASPPTPGWVKRRPCISVSDLDASVTTPIAPTLKKLLHAGLLEVPAGIFLKPLLVPGGDLTSEAATRRFQN